MKRTLDFGPVCLGTIYCKNKQGWTPWLPAQGVLEVDVTFGVRLSPDLDLTHPVRMPRGLRWLSLQDFGDPLAVQPTDLRVRSVAQLALPAGLPATQAQDIARRWGSQVVQAGIDIDIPRGDPLTLRTTMDGFAREHPNMQLPQDVRDAITVASIFADAGQFSRALALISPWVASRDVGALKCAADWLHLLDHPHAAYGALDQALMIDPRDGRIWSTYAGMLHRTGCGLEAVHMAQRGLALAPGDAWAKVVLARALIHLGQLQRAEQLAQEVVRDDPGTSNTDLLLAELATLDVAHPHTFDNFVVNRIRRRNSVDAWKRYLSHNPESTYGLNQLAQAQKLYSPWGRGWSRTSLAAVQSDLGNASLGQRLITTASEHPSSVAFTVALSASVIGWFLVAVLPSHPLGLLPMLAGGFGLIAYLITRHLFPAQLRAVAGKKRERVMIRYAVIMVIGLVMLVLGKPQLDIWDRTRRPIPAQPTHTYYIPTFTTPQAPPGWPGPATQLDPFASP